MLYRIALYFLFTLATVMPVFSQAQKLPVIYLNARGVVEMAKASGKPYLWVAIYVPKCASGPLLFKERAEYYNKNKDKVELVMLSILYSESNVDTTASFSQLYNFDKPFYAVDTMYAKEDRTKSHVEFMADLNKILGVEEEFFQHIIIDQKGKVVYRTDGLPNYKKIDKLLR